MQSACLPTDFIALQLHRTFAPRFLTAVRPGAPVGPSACIVTSLAAVPENMQHPSQLHAAVAREHRGGYPLYRAPASVYLLQVAGPSVPGPPSK